MYHRRSVFAAACLGMLLFGIVFLSLGSANNMLAERFHLNDNQIGTLTVLLPFGILLGSIVFGPVVDRFGYKGMLVVASLLVGVSLEGLAFAPSERYVQFFIFLIGFGGGVINGATNALTSDISEGDHGAKLSLLGVYFGIGALGMPGTLAALSRHFSLTSIIAGIGAVVLIPAVYCMAIQFPPPKAKGDLPFLSSGIALLKEPVFLFAGLALAIQSGMEGMSNDWMTRYFKKVTLAGQHVEEWKTLLGLMAVTGAMVAARLVLSGLLRRIAPPRVLFGSIGIAAGGALLLTFSESYGTALIAALMIGAGLAAGFPVVLSYIGQRYASRSGTAFSLIFFLALIGNMVINKSFGVLATIHGVRQYGWVMLACLAISATLLALVLRLLKTPNNNT